MQEIKKVGLYDYHFEKDSCGVGAIVNIEGTKTNKAVKQALEILTNLEHRGGFASDGKTGDGAGILIQIPDKFFKSLDLGFTLPNSYAVANMFLSNKKDIREKQIELINKELKDHDITLLGYRDIPINSSILTKQVIDSMPYIIQMFVTNPLKGKELERLLYITRRSIEKKANELFKNESFYFLSFSSKTIVYKGMLASSQIADFYLDFQSELVESAIALVHSRYSTNTFPNWERAHPNRFMIHNGEINTIRGNIDSIKARQSVFKSDVLNLDDVYPIINKYSSDSAMFDNALEFFYMNGKELEEALVMMIPECWTKDDKLSSDVRSFMEYNANMMEPWDGPASIIFTDGDKLGAILDRNGLRPSKYFLTKDGFMVFSSETGACRLNEDEILAKKRISPGKLLVVDTVNKKIKFDDEIKKELANKHPYYEWVKSIVRLDYLPSVSYKQENIDESTQMKMQINFGYSFDEIKETLLPICQTGNEAVGAMGVDTPLPVLSDKEHLLYDYFKQLFAQVTNPPIDPIREDLVFSSRLYLGKEGNILKTSKDNLKKIKIPSPILSMDDYNKLLSLDKSKVNIAFISTLYSYNDISIKEALDNINVSALKAVKEGNDIIVLSDYGYDDNKIAIPMLLATSSIHHFLVRNELRCNCSLICYTGEARQIHHFATLIGFGATAICPYLAYETIKEYVNRGYLTDVNKSLENYMKGSLKGIIKIISKMGISTIQSYTGSQIFECLGLSDEVVDNYFTNTRNSVGGISLPLIEKEVINRHSKAINNNDVLLDFDGVFHLKANKEKHIFNVESIYHLQEAVKNNDYEEYKAYVNSINNKIDHLRDLFTFDATHSISIDEVESEEDIIKHFKVSAMSFGALSKEAHECLAMAMNKLGCKSNCGEGGEDSKRYGTDKSSAIKQVASGRFGVTIEYLNNAKEIQIKIAQGAKPGEGGQLPAQKVYPWIADARNSTPGVALISPPPHHDIYSIEDLEQLIFDLKHVNPNAKIGVKLVSEAGIGTIAAGVVKAGANTITICGYDGGTGASPKTSTYNAGIPWEIGLAETHQTLILNNLRDRIVLANDSKLLSGRDIAISCMLGAEEFGFATLPLIALGCVMMRVCNLNTCPMGICTQNEALRANFKGKVEYIVNLMHFLARDLREQMALLGFKAIKEMVGRSDRLTQMHTDSEKLNSINLSNLIGNFPYNKNVCFKEYKESDYSSGIDNSIIINKIKEEYKEGNTLHINCSIKNTDRAIGTEASSYIYNHINKNGLNEDSIVIDALGNGGNSFGAFAIKGLTLRITGDSNDYVGKGLSGGKIIIKPSDKSSYDNSTNLIAGNVCLYGATTGKLFIDGLAGERFAVRNSGVTAVVLGIGAHGLEYMTGGKVLILGPIGKNLAAGMSGGVAYIKGKESINNINKQLVDVVPLTDEDINIVKNLMKEHIKETSSNYVSGLLESFNADDYFKVLPKEYAKMINLIDKYIKQGKSEDEAKLLAFKEGVC